MAKTKIDKNEVLDSLFAEMSKINPFGDSLDKSDYSLPTEFIHTGNYILNAAFTGSLRGGVPNNRSIALAGLSGTGKTYVALNIIKWAQSLGYTIIFYDTEGAVDREMAIKFGIDPVRFRYEPMSDLSKFKTSITTLCKTLMDIKLKKGNVPKLMICLDSLGMLATMKEINDALSGSDAADMTRAKTIRSLFRLITSDLTGLKIPFVFTNHVGVNIGGYGDPIAMGGGEGLKYAASIIPCFQISKLKEDDKDDKRQTGVLVKVKMFKNRFAQPITVEFHIDFRGPLNPYIGLHPYISWENCGIEKGNIFYQKDYEKASEADKAKFKPFKMPDGKDAYFVAKESAMYFIVRHLGEGVKAKDLFNSRVFTNEVIDELDEKVIKPLFAFGTNDVITEIDEIISEEEIEIKTNTEKNDEAGEQIGEE